MNDLLIQQGRAVSGQASTLFVLLHGVGSNARDLQPLGAQLARQHPQAWVVCVQSPDPSDLGSGWQWFSVRGVTEANRPQRVAAAMPGFVLAVQKWQAQSGSDADHTTLLGFSQGAIMALESTQLAQPVASRIVAMAGRFASPPERRPARARIHLLHGQDDGVVPAQASVAAHARLLALGGQPSDTTLDMFPGLGHGIDGRMMARLVAHLAQP